MIKEIFLENILRGYIFDTCLFIKARTRISIDTYYTMLRFVKSPHPVNLSLCVSLNDNVISSFLSSAKVV